MSKLQATRRSTPLPILLALLFGCAALAAAAPQAKNELPLLTQVSQLLNLPSAEADLHYPVHFQGFLTFFDAEGGLCFLQDETGGIYIYQPVLPATLKRGLRVEVHGSSGAGRFTPIVLASNIVARGEGKLPPPRRVSLGRVVSGAEDSQWVVIQGVVRSQREDGGNLVLELAATGSRLTARVYSYTAGTARIFVDSRVLVRGVAAAAFNSAGQLSNFHLLVPSLAEVSVVEPPAAAPFDLPVRPLGSLLSYSPGGIFASRIHVRGVVTCQLLGQAIFIQDATGALRIQTRDRTPLTVGDVIDASGFATQGDYAILLDDAVFQKSGAAAPPLARPMTAQQALGGAFENHLVQIEARLLDSLETQTNRQVLLLQAGQSQFNALLSTGQAGRGAIAVPTGSRLRLTGICTLQRGAFNHPESWTLWLRSPADAVLLQRPAQWVLVRLMGALALVAACALGGVVWMHMLRRRVEQQTARLRRRETALEGRYRDLFENANDIIFTLDLAGRFTSLNQAGERATGYHRDEMTRLNLTDITLDKDTPRVRDLLAQAQAGQRHGQCELEIRSKDDVPVVLEANWRLEFHEGEPQGIRIIARDITERRQAEEALRHSEQQLRRFATERERLARDLHDEIIQCIYAVGLGLEDCGRLIASNAALAEARLQKSLEQLNMVIRQVRHYIHSLEPEAVQAQDFEPALQAVALTLDQSEDSRFLLRIDRAAVLRLTSWQATQLLHIAREAMSNSARHAHAKSTAVSLQPRNGSLCLEILDNGIGFEPGAAKSSGCGLSNMAARARELNAQFELTSAPGHGTRIVVRFPNSLPP